jgi:plastocyanin
MTKYVRILLLAVAASAVVAVPVAQAKPTRAAAAIAVTAGKPSEFGFKLSTKTVKHGAVTFTVTNAGAIPHTFKICSKAVKTAAADTCAGKGTAMLNAGQKATVTFTFKAAGTYEYLCTVPGHAAGGMKGILKVT